MGTFPLDQPEVALGAPDAPTHIPSCPPQATTVPPPPPSTGPGGRRRALGSSASSSPSSYPARSNKALGLCGGCVGQGCPQQAVRRGGHFAQKSGNLCKLREGRDVWGSQSLFAGGGGRVLHPAHGCGTRRQAGPESEPPPSIEPESMHPHPHLALPLPLLLALGLGNCPTCTPHSP